VQFNIDDKGVNGADQIDRNAFRARRELKEMARVRL